jgi:hypothetical protein
MMGSLASRKRGPKEMTPGELIDHLKKQTKGEVEYNETLIQLLEKFSIPLAVLLMGIIGVPLGAQLRSTGRSIGVVIGMVTFLIYYIFLAGVRSVCETGTVPPVVGVWLPDLFLFISCIVLLRRAAKERPINIFEKISWKWNRSQDHEYDEKHEGDIQRSQGLEQTIPVTGRDEVHGQSEIPSEGGQYLGNKRMTVYHRVDCKWAEKISSVNRIAFNSKEEALEEGYSPCKVCQP